MSKPEGLQIFTICTFENYGCECEPMSGACPCPKQFIDFPEPPPHSVFVILFLYFAPDSRGLELLGIGLLPSPPWFCTVSNKKALKKKKKPYAYLSILPLILQNLYFYLIKHKITYKITYIVLGFKVNFFGIFLSSV